MKSNLFLVALTFAVFFHSTSLWAKIILVPEYEKIEKLYFSGDLQTYNNAKNEQSLYYLYMIGIGNAPTHIINDDHIEYDNTWKNTLVNDCKKKFGQCHPINVVQFDQQKHFAPWIQDQMPLHAWDTDTEEKKHLYYGYQGLKIRPKGIEISDEIPLRLQPSLLIADGLGHIYTTEKLYEINKSTYSKNQIEAILHEYYAFEQLIWLHYHPKEETGHVDTVVQFLRGGDRKVHAVYSSTEGVSYLNRSNSRHVALEGFTVPKPMVLDADEREACVEHLSNPAVKNQNEYEMILAIAMAKLSKHIDLAYNYFCTSSGQIKNDFEGYQDIQCELKEEAFMQALLSFPNAKSVTDCLGEKIKNNDAKFSKYHKNNREILLNTGFSPDRVHSMPIAGYYIAPENVYPASYVNSLLLGKTAVIPSFPAFANLDEDGNLKIYQKPSFGDTDSMYYDSIYSDKDARAKQFYKIFFDKVYTFFSPRFLGGAVHCMSYGVYRPND